MTFQRLHNTAWPAGYMRALQAGIPQLTTNTGNNLDITAQLLYYVQNMVTIVIMKLYVKAHAKVKSQNVETVLTSTM